MPAPKTFDRIEVVQFPSPGQQASVLKITRDPSSGGYDTLPEGTPLTELPFLAARDVAPYQAGTFRLAKIVFQQERHLHDWYFVNEREDQEAYNFEFKYLDEASSKPLLVRTYVIPRADYTVTVEGTADPVYEDLHLIAQEQVRTDDPIFDSLFVVDRRTYTTLPGVVMDGGQYGDRLSIPRDFLATLETETEEQKVPPGTPPDNGDRVIESTIVPETNNLSIRKTERAKVPMSTTSYETNREGQVVTVTRTLDMGMQTVTPSATVDESVDQKSGGMSLKERKEVPAVFAAPAFSTSKDDLTPQEFRAAVAEQTIAQTVAGTAAMPTLGVGEIAKSEQQQTEFVKRTQVTLRDTSEVPATLTHKKTGQWNTETITKSLGTDNTLDTGFLTSQSEVRDLGDGRFVKEKTVIDTPHAQLIGYKTDETTGVQLRITKTLVPAGTTPPAGFVEMQPLDKWHTIQIVTSVLGGLPATETFGGVASYSYPDELEGVGVFWQMDKGGSAGASGFYDIPKIEAQQLGWDGRIEVEAFSSLGGTVWTKIKNGHRGAVRTSTTRTYHTGVPSIVPSVTAIRPVIGTVTLKGTAVRQSKYVRVSGRGSSKLFQGSGGGYSGKTWAQSVSFGPVVHSGASLQYASPPSATSGSMNASTGSLPGGGTYPSTSVESAAQGFAELHLPSASLPPSSHIIAVNIERWRFGVYVMEVVTAHKP